MARYNGPVITVHACNREKAEELFQMAGFGDFREQERPGGFVAFRFPKLPDEDVDKVSRAIPLEMYAYRLIGLSCGETEEIGRTET